KLPVIFDLKTDRASDSNRHTEVRKPGVIYIKEGNTKFYLNDAGKVDKINFRLKRCAALVSKAHDTCKYRKGLGLDDLVERTFDKILRDAVFLGVDKDGNLA